jgi:integrase/recombinase XerD
MATSIYFRRKTEKGWRYIPLRVGARPADCVAPFYIRVRNEARKYQWMPQDSIESARDASKNQPLVRAAQARGISVDEHSNAANTNRTSIVEAVKAFLYRHRDDRPKTVQAYTTTLTQLLANLPRGIRFVDQLATTEALDGHKEHLKSKGYGAETIGSRMTVIFSLLKSHRKETGVDFVSTLVKLPKVQRTSPKAYSQEDLQKLFAVMTPEEYLRYLFFVRTGCRDQEVAFATWRDLDLKNLTYTVTGQGKSDTTFATKNGKERTVKLTTELRDLLETRRKNPPNARWIFVNKDGEPERKFLKKFKAIAKRAGLNCGNCITTVVEGRYDHAKPVEASCANRPTCEEHYLHRLRKTAATNWLRNGFDLMTIRNWLGHSDLSTTQIYLEGSTVSNEAAQAKYDEAGKF